MMKSLRSATLLRRASFATLLLGALLCLKLSAQEGPKDVGTKSPPPAEGPQKVAIVAKAFGVDGPQRIKLTARAKFYTTVSLIFTGSDGRLTEVSGVNARGTFKFEPAETAATAAPVAPGNCASTNLGGKRKMVVCLLDASAGKVSLEPGRGSESPSKFYEVFNSLDVGAAGGQTCWQSAELKMSVCYGLTKVGAGTLTHQ